MFKKAFLLLAGGFILGGVIAFFLTQAYYKNIIFSLNIPGQFQSGSLKYVEIKCKANLFIEDCNNKIQKQFVSLSADIAKEFNSLKKQQFLNLPFIETPSPTALCRDGTYSYSQNRQGTCSHHGGVAVWY